jgi:hypothetical protein
MLAPDGLRLFDSSSQRANSLRHAPSIQLLGGTDGLQYDTATKNASHKMM